MNSEVSGDARPVRPVRPARSRRRLSAEIKESLRELSIQLALLNHQVVARLDFNDGDLLCLDLIARQGPLSPSALAHRAGLHPATITGILDRLERGGWVVRERDPADRRAVTVRALRGRNAELLGLYSGMSTSMDDVCAHYADAELELLASFLRRTSAAGKHAVEQLADGEPAAPGKAPGGGPAEVSRPASQPRQGRPRQGRPRQPGPGAP
jgi:DNA-binding MarR family transcriptional regulator